MVKTICTFKGTFTGIYEWGKGWASMEIRDKWNNYWRNLGNKSIFWGFFEKECQYLNCVGGNIFLHPMDFNGILMGCGVCEVKYENGIEKREYFNHELSELNQLCSECAEICGGTFKLEISDTKQVDMGVLYAYEK